MLPVVVLAGGLGTRVASLTGGTTPKVLLPVNGRPFLDYKLAGLAVAGARDVVLLLGHGAAAVAAHVGDGSRWGLRVRTHVDGPRLLGTGGAVREVIDTLPEAFWVTYGDSYLRADMAALEGAYRHLAATDGVMTVLRNRDALQPSNADVDGGRVVAYSKGDRTGAHEYIDYGLLLLPAAAFRSRPAGAEFDLGEIVQELIAAGRMHAAVVDARFYDVGTPEALAETAEFLRGVELELPEALP